MIPSLTNTGDFQEFREAQTGKDSEEQLVWKGVPRNTWRIGLIVKFIYCVRGYECSKLHLVEISTMHKEDSHFTSPLPSP